MGRVHSMAIVVVGMLLAACTSTSPDAVPATESSQSNPASPAPVPERTGAIPFPTPGPIYGPMSQGPSTAGPIGPSGETPLPPGSQIPSPPPPIPNVSSDEAGGMPPAGACNVRVGAGPAADAILLSIEYAGEPTQVWVMVESSLGRESGPLEVSPGMNQRVIPNVDSMSVQVRVFALPRGPAGAPICVS